MKKKQSHWNSSGKEGKTVITCLLVNSESWVDVLIYRLSLKNQEPLAVSFLGVETER